MRPVLNDSRRYKIMELKTTFLAMMLAEGTEWHKASHEIDEIIEQISKDHCKTHNKSVNTIKN